MNNQITAIGRLTAPAEIRFTAAGVPVASFTIAYNDRVKDPSGEWKDGPAHFLDVSAWRALGESCAELQKGQRVVVVGELKSRHWETSAGEKRTGWQVDADEVGVLMNRFTQMQGQGAGWSKPEPAAGRDPWATASNDEPPL